MTSDRFAVLFLYGKDDSRQLQKMRRWGPGEAIQGGGWEPSSSRARWPTRCRRFNTYRTPDLGLEIRMSDLCAG